MIFKKTLSYMRLRTWLLVFGITIAFLLADATMAYAFLANQCAAERFATDDLVCTAGDVSITNILVVGDTSSCIGGNNLSLDLQLTVNFSTPDRWDIGVFVANDGKNPKLLISSGGSTSCSVTVLPTSSQFLDLDGVPAGTADTCGDGNNSINGTGYGILYMPGVTVKCQALAGSSGNLYIPYVVSWDNQASPSGSLCTSIADPVPNTKSKCNAPTILQGSVSVVVMPKITMTDSITTIKSGNSTTYSVLIENLTGVSISGVVFKDPVVSNINVTGLTCSASGGATCPVGFTIADMQGAGITIPAMPINGSVTFNVVATLTGSPGDTRTNTSTATLSGQTASASDTDTIVGDIAILPTSLSKNGTPNTWMVFNYTLYNYTASNDTIGLSAVSNQGWTVLIRDASDTATISSIANVPAGGSADFIVKVQIPSGATTGTIDTTTITATSGNDPSKTATATAVTTVSLPLTFTPDNNGAGGKGSSLFYSHRVQNNTASNYTGNPFSTAFSNSCTGWTVGVYKADKVSQIPPASVTLAPFGGYEDIEVKLTIPSTASTGDVCTATVTATVGGNSAYVTDVTTVKDIILYSDPGYTDESYIFPAGNWVYAKAFGALGGAPRYRFRWYDSSNTLMRTSSCFSGPGTLPDSYQIPSGGPFGTWRVEVYSYTTETNCNNNTSPVLFVQTSFYVGPDHLNASYTGANPNVNTSVSVPITLHDRYNHSVPLDPSTSNAVRGNPPITKDALKITVTVSGSATITEYCNPGCTSITPAQSVTFNLPATGGTKGTARVTITDSVRETVTVAASSYNSALYGSPSRDETTTVTFVGKKRVKIIDWREVIK